MPAVGEPADLIVIGATVETLVPDAPRAAALDAVVLSLPYMYRAVDTGLRAIDVRTLTEAALSFLGIFASIARGKVHKGQTDPSPS